MRLRSLLPLMTVAMLAAAPAGAHAGLTVGVSDQRAEAFANPFYPAANLTVARYIVPYDVTSDPAQTVKLEAWLAGAEQTGQQVLMSFEHSRKDKVRAGKLPTPENYRKAITKFKAKYGARVDDISPWNEVNRKFDPLRGEGQPTWNRPDIVARYYGVAMRVFPKSKIVALDVLDQASVGATVRYIEKFKAAVAKRKLPKVKIWGLHPYSDINRFSTKRTKAMLKAIGKGEVWLTEASGLVQFGKDFPYDEQRAAAANKCMFTIAKLTPRIKRLYVYGYVGSPAFDSGLVGADGQPRPGYTVVQKRQAGPCRKP